LHQQKVKAIIVQKGSREHFLAARALYRRGMLGQLVVDWYAPSNPLLRWILSCGSGRRRQAALAVRADEIPDSLVQPNRINGLLGRWKQSISPSGRSPYERALQADIAFTKTVARLNLPPHDVFFGYSYMSLEVLREEKRRGKLCVLDQIDPGEKEHEIIREEQSRWRQFVVHPDAVIPPLVYQRLHEEWRLADIIIVNSEWSRQCNIEKGAPEGKLFVVPLAYEADSNPSILADREPFLKAPPSASDTVRILWVGRVTLQKGIQYLIEAARLLKREAIEFLIAGETSISRKAMADAPDNVRWLGKVTHAQKEELYDSATAFVLPTLSDGFALTQLEALAHGLPVIATPNCGRVVEDGKTGFIVPPRDPQALADAILKFAAGRNLSASMAPACRIAVQAYSIENYGQRLVEIIDKQMATEGLQQRNS
jgi:glycosyltransferase involved in cell wall biosynthesis